MVKMVTGDNMVTAKAIAEQVGLGIRAINGEELEKHKGRELMDLINRTDIFARVSPAHKVLVLKTLQDQGHIVAMTGDGVNDAPALKNSDVGIGMGIRGADISKEVSDMVLLDDNFITIKQAIKQGRTTFQNIRKFVNYLLTSNIAEVFVVFIISLFGKLALVPVQLLWINLLTDGLPALALGVDPALPGIMKQKPRKKGEGIVNRRLILLVLVVGLIITALVVPLFFIGLKNSLALAQTLVFTSLVVFELLRIAVIRGSEKLTLFSNKWLVFAVIASIGLQLIVLYTPLGRFFGVVPLGLFEWGLILGLGIIGYFLSYTAGLLIKE
jgi:P-type Ca2+ transporter type 2C